MTTLTINHQTYQLVLPEPQAAQVQAVLQAGLDRVHAAQPELDATSAALALAANLVAKQLEDGAC